MAQDSSQEKTEQPTPRRLRDARKKGQVYKSKDLETVVVLFACFGAMLFSQAYIAGQLKKLMEESFHLVARANLQWADIYDLGKLSLVTLIKCSLPVLMTGVITALLAGFLQVGGIFSMDPLKPDLKKLNALENLKNMFKPKIFFELFKNLIKIFAIFLVAYSVLKGLLEPFLMTVTTDVEGIAKVGQMVTVRFVVRFLILFILIAVLDLYMQRREYIKNLKMSKEEVKREYKEDEGDPLIKGQRRQIHMEMAMGDVKQRVRTADAVITNPTHLAIAVKYDKDQMMAPQVVAKGQRLFAEYIRNLAEEFDVPIVRNIPLAWALIELEIDDEVPETLYTTVAEILAFVYKLKEGR